MTVLPQSFALLPMLAAAVVATAAPASAEEFISNGRTTEVHYKDLDLSKDADRHMLDLRIKRAAVRVCPERNLRASRACQLAAIEHVREPIYAAIAKANGKPGEAFADKGSDKPVGAAR
ncbi:MAG TPA: UrcA family protein [Sphingobium sp.]|nr:UrcA family protein [Sphingobium sp.]